MKGDNCLINKIKDHLKTIIAILILISLGVLIMCGYLFVYVFLYIAFAMHIISKLFQKDTYNN